MFRQIIWASSGHSKKHKIQSQNFKHYLKVKLSSQPFWYKMYVHKIY